MPQVCHGQLLLVYFLGWGSADVRVLSEKSSYKLDQNSDLLCEFAIWSVKLVPSASNLAHKMVC